MVVAPSVRTSPKTNAAQVPIAYEQSQWFSKCFTSGKMRGRFDRRYGRTGTVLLLIISTVLLSDLGKMPFKSHLILEFEDVDVVINAVENFIGWNGFDAKRIFSCRATPPSPMKYSPLANGTR